MNRHFRHNPWTKENLSSPRRQEHFYDKFYESLHKAAAGRSGPPPEFIDAIMTWLDESLSSVVKRCLRIRRSRISPLVTIDFVGPSDSNRRFHSATIFFRDDVVSIESSATSNQRVVVDYADPRLFDIVLAAVMRFYNGV